MFSISLLPRPVIRVYRECNSVGKVAWFVVYIFGNLLVVVQKKGSRWLWRHWCSIHHWCATSWATPKKHFVKNRQFLTDWIIRQAQNGLILYLCNIYSIYLCIERAYEICNDVMGREGMAVVYRPLFIISVYCSIELTKLFS